MIKKEEGDKNVFNIPEGRKLDCIPVGRLAIDINPLVMPQSFAECTEFGKYVGGSPANTAVGLARLGARTGFIGTITDDSLGDFCLDYFKKDGIDTNGIFRAEKNIPMAVTFTEVINGKTNLMLYRDRITADMLLKPEDISEDYIASSRSVIISGTALAASPSRDAAFKILELARKHGLLIIFDVDYRAPIWSSNEEISIYYTLAARYAHIIIGSREEYDLMDCAYHKASSDEQTAERWFNEKAELIIIKHGAEGSMAYAKNGERYKIDIAPVNAVKSTGGGDAYSSAFVYGVLAGREVKNCLELATTHASLAVACNSCSDAMVDIKTLEEAVAKAKSEHGELVNKF